ncbi:MAG: putative nuclease of putative toxin-antitoxin system [Phenylobacterium sp.]|jgi:predicted nuclease of predicted toxin-antitoxin system
MKLLLDNNLSHRLVARIIDLYPESSHVMTVGLDEAEDEEIWDYAKKNGFTIVTKDADYDDLSLVKGTPPKVIWLKVGNCRIATIESMIRNNATTLNNFIESDAGIMEISQQK